MKLPSYRLHKATQQGIILLSGRMYYCGPFSDPASKAKADKLLAEWLGRGRTPEPVAGSGITVTEVIAAYLDHVLARPQAPQHLDSIKRALGVARTLYGDAPASDFKGKALKAVRAKMLSDGICRSLANARTGHVKRCFRWALSEELVPAEGVQSLLAVAGLRKGDGNARETEPVKPVPEADVEATLPFLPRVVADMVRVQLLSGMRPGEACRLRASEIDRSQPDLWVWRPKAHKTAHHGHGRQVFFGPKAIAVLSPYLEREGVVFSPRLTRKVVSRRVGERYTRHSYARCVARACKRAGVGHWHPGQLRHTAATRLVALYGWELARLMLGHRSVNITRLYAEDDLQRIADVVRSAC